MAFCLDTAHLWGAGYDISTPEGADAVVSHFDQLIGLVEDLAQEVGDGAAPPG